MDKKQNISRFALSLLCVVVGNFLYALAVKLFLLPTGLVAGGTTGIALAVNHFFGMPVSLFVLIFNVAMLIAGYLILGKQFALTTVVSTFVYPFALEVFDRLLGDYIMTNDILLCTVFTGFGIGISLGVVIRNGASTGGMDIPPLILNKLFRIPVSASMYVFDVCILLAQAIFSPAENVLYAVMMVIVYTIVLDKVLFMGTSKIEVKIISEKSDEIRTAILKTLDRGVTMLDGEGGYLHNKTQLVLSVISNRELPKLEKLAHNIDSECFMIISHVKEVRGRGFSMHKQYR